MNSRRIEPKLFELLEEIGPLIEKTTDQSKDEKARLAILRIRDNLTSFCKNFLIQFFHSGYGYMIDGMNAITTEKANDFFLFRVDRPTEMMRILSEYTLIHIDVMGDPYIEETKESRKLYCRFIPEMFKAFMQEGSGVIDNFAEVVDKMNETLAKVNDTCKRLNKLGAKD
jgi:hypothetical protein